MFFKFCTQQVQIRQLQGQLEDAKEFNEANQGARLSLVRQFHFVSVFSQNYMIWRLFLKKSFIFRRYSHRFRNNLIIDSSNSKLQF